MSDFDRQRRLIRTLGLVALTAAVIAVWAVGKVRRSGEAAGVDAPPMDQVGTSEGGLSGWVADEPASAPDFTLTATDGSPFTLSEQRDNVVLLFFGYTNCPDVCPQTLTWLGEALKTLDADAAVKVVFVSIDPERDTPEVIAKYVGGYDPRILGVTGDIPELEKIVAGYSSNFFKEVEEHEHAPGTPTEHTHDEYTMAHPSEVYVIDRAGQIREFLSLPFSPDEVVNDVGVLLKEG